MARPPTKKPIKPRTDGKAASGALFDPAAFFATAAPGRDISRHLKKEVIFAQGDDADAVFYIRKCQPSLRFTTPPTISSNKALRLREQNR